VARDDLRERDHDSLKFQRLIIRMALNLHAHEDGETEIDLVSAQHCPIAFDVALALQPFDPS